MIKNTKKLVLLSHSVNKKRYYSDNINTNKIKRDMFHLRYKDFSLDEIRKNFNSISDGRYSVIVRVSYIPTENIELKEGEKLEDKLNDISYIKGAQTAWITLDNQISINLDKEKRDNNIKSLFDVIESRFEKAKVYYNIKDYFVVQLQFLVFGVEYTNVIKKSSYSSKSLGDKKDLVNTSKAENTFNKIVPFPNVESIKTDLIKLESTINNTNSDSIKLKDGTNLNLSGVLKEKEVEIDNNTEFYQNNKKDNLISVVNKSTENDVINIDTSVYTTQGNFITNVVDNVYKDNTYKRSSGNVTLKGDSKSSETSKEIDIKLKPIHSFKTTGVQSKLMFSDWRVGTIDLETYYSKSEDINKVYAVGFHTEDKTDMFYINDNLDSDELILNLLDKLLTEQYSRYTFYVHNLGRFDAPFVIRVLLKANRLDSDKYEYNPFFRDNRLYSIDISKKVKTKTYYIKIVDSYNILNSSLDDLCKTFKPSVKKGIFPYGFVRENTLFYSGEKPDITYYKKMKKINIDKETRSLYKEIPKKNWSTKEETLKYLKDDLISLYQVFKEFSTHIFMEHYVQTTRSLTISGLAMEIFLNGFYNKKNKFYNKNIPLINKKSMYNDIRASYYGGITEVYKPYGKSLYYYDVNSLYPYSALKDLPGLECKFYENINKNIKYVSDLFGFYYCKIRTSDNYFGLLPVRSSEDIVMPNGYIEGWYFSEELKFASDNGYDIDVIKGYEFNREPDVFKKYISHFYNIKSTTKDDTTKAISKSLLNNLLGRLGLNIDKWVTRLVDLDELNELLQHKESQLIAHIEDKFLVTHSNNISLDICYNHDVDFVETFNNIIKYDKSSRKSFNDEKLNNVSIAISSAVTAYSRIYMNQIKLDILRKGGSIYYTDTDSIVTDIKLDSNLVGSDIGKFKLEYILDYGYFISNKTYCISGKDIKKDKKVLIMKTKGGTPITYNNKTNKYRNLSKYDFKRLYEGNKLDIVRFESKTDYGKGTVSLNSKNDISLSPFSYKKREKIYENNVWVDTRPLTNTRNFTSLSTSSTLDESYIILFMIFGALCALKYLIIYFVFYNYIPIINTDITMCTNVSNNIENNLCINIYNDNVSYHNDNICFTPRGVSEKIIDYINSIKFWWVHIFSNKTTISIQHIDTISMCYNIDMSNKSVDTLQLYKPNILWEFYNTNLDKLDKELVEYKTLVSKLLIHQLNNRVDTLNDYYTYIDILNKYKSV